jgi:hypothetical protein
MVSEVGFGPLVRAFGVVETCFGRHLLPHGFAPTAGRDRGGFESRTNTQAGVFRVR